MKVFVLALLAVAATAAPIDNVEPVELIVNGVPEGEPLEIGDIVSIKLKEHENNELVSSTDLLHPLTAAGLAEAAAQQPDAVQIVDGPETVQIVEGPEAVEVVDVPEPVLVVEDAQPSPIVLPEPALPEVNPPALPESNPPAGVEHPVLVIPDLDLNPVDLVPLPISPPESELVVAPVEILPEAVPQIPNGEIFNDGVVQVTVNAPEDPGLFGTLQSWFSMAVNYFSPDGVQTTHQIV
ncbi:uncharacterized protein LOC131852939 [Achroia grisella]|uniref:uncharacterized protein LOC131852939 n=1 Tax=Achroia grisella TaxID=688607 RepID=UPI0027D32B90|nr:uncharacterized protein LOC131852939 [Achroia grisella]